MMNEMDKNHMLEDFHAIERTHEGYRASEQKGHIHMHHQENTKTIEDLDTLPCKGEGMLHREHIITQQQNNLTQTPQSASTCQQCHVELCHELSWPHHYYGPYLL